ncbi:LacI family DNA-binding transcriptional regulator [Ferrovibrio terrae]|uniref:LacI family DNA-binding transcriptional regulator n=1 Tax=Ferrovibrio terrae TaxID=2594003 RepID=UPI003137E95F
MSTITDVARLAGVSASTVSNVLNGRVDRMSKETLGRVQQAVAELGFRPNRTARQLKTGQIAMLGLLVPSMGNPSYGLLAREIEIVARERHGYRVIVANTYREPQQERAFLDDMWSQGVRGVIVISSLADEAHFEEPVSRGLVAVSYDSHARRDRQPILDYVSADNAAGASLAVQHLVSQGHRTIAFLTPSGWTFSRAEKREGFMAAVQQAGIKGVVIAGSTASHYADEEMAELGQSLATPLVQHTDRPTAAVAINDMMAIGLMAGLREQGLQLPRDMSVVGMDGIPLGAYMAPPLTTIRLPLPDLAGTMVDRIMLRLKQPSTVPDEFRFASTLLERGSVAPPPR